MSIKIKTAWRRWHYKNTLLLILSLILFYLLVKMPFVDNLLKSAGTLGYFGAFVAGMFFVSTFTVAPAAVVLYHMVDASYHPIEVALFAGLGAMLGDYIIFRFLRDRIFDELRPLFKRFGRPYTKVLFRSPYFAWIIPVAGAAIIASPFPDEVGVGMLGLSKLKQWQFFLLTLALNTVGIFIVLVAAHSV